MMGLIFVYIVLYKLLYNNGYLSFEEPVGTIRLQLQAPTVGVPGSSTFDPGYPPYEYNFTALDRLPYCAQDKGGHAISKHQCELMGAVEAVYPVTGTSPFFISTRVQESKQSLDPDCLEPPASRGYTCKQTYRYGCNGTFDFDPKCKDFSQKNYFLADIDRFTLLIDHAVRAPANPKLQADSTSMEGKLVKCDDESRSVSPSSTAEGQDFFEIGDLLDAVKMRDGTCGTTLDDKSTVKGSSHSIRHDGAIIQLEIRYKNSDPWVGIFKDDRISYTYHVSLIDGTKSKVLQEIFAEYPTKRITRNRHGIQIVVLQTGLLGTFDFSTALINLTTSLTLLAMSTTIVDLLAMKVMPRKEEYRSTKYEVVDMDSISDSDRFKYSSLNEAGYGMETSNATTYGALAGSSYYDN
eukprot:g2211.t1